LISRIPRIRGGHPSIGDGGQVAIQVLRKRVGSKRGLLIVGIVPHGRERGRNRSPGEGSPRLNPIPRRIVRVRQIADDRGPLLVRQARELARRIVRIGDAVAIRQRERRSAVSIVVRQRHRARALLDLREPIRVVVGVGHRGLPGHGQARLS